jgi:hypothetical protein
MKSPADIHLQHQLNPGWASSNPNVTSAFDRNTFSESYNSIGACDNRVE